MFRTALGVTVLALAVTAAPATASTPRNPFDYARQHVTVHELGTTAVPGAVIHDITYRAGTHIAIRAFLVTPTAAGTHPATLYLHWLGDAATSNRHEFLREAVARAAGPQHAVALLPNIGFPFTHGPVGDARDYDLVVRQTIQLRRGLDLLNQRPDVDRHRVAVVGHDYGSMYGAIIAAVDRDRVRATVIMAADTTWANWFVLYFLDLPPDQVPGYTATLAPLDPQRRLPQASGRMLLQYAADDFYIHEDVRAAMFDAAPRGSQDRTYPTDHPLALAQVRNDRDAFLDSQDVWTRPLVHPGWPSATAGRSTMRGDKRKDERMALRPDTETELDRIARERQRKHRVPGLFAGVVRDGGLSWGLGVGAADIDDLDTAPTADDQFLVASNTETFTAVLVMQLRDEGKLDLDDPLDKHVPSVTHSGVTIRSMLSHVSGMQREPVGDVWETMVNPDRDELLAGFNEAERIHRPHHVFHYSNLAFSMLGELVARLDEREWAASLQARLLDPLGMTRTTVGLSGAAVSGYYVPPYSDVPVLEAVLDLKALAPCGGLASTATDMARWSAFVADPPSDVLSPDTLEEMLQPQIMIDTQRWGSSVGLGFMLFRSGDRLYAGHTGGMPGHITGIFTDRAGKTGAVVLMNSTSAPDPAAFAVELADAASKHEPVTEPAWRPGTAVPDELVGVLGLWFSEGSPFVFSVRAGVLEARAEQAPDDQPPSVFEKVSADVYRTTSGRERGELLRITRTADGTVTKMNWATYLVSRAPLAFGQSAGT